MVLSQILNYVNKNLAKIRNIDQEFVKHLDFKNIKVSVHKKNYAKILKQNNIFWKKITFFKKRVSVIL